MRQAWLLVLVAVLGGSLGQLLMKSALPLPSPAAPGSGEWLSWQAAREWATINLQGLLTLAAGIACYVFSMFAWVVALRSVTLSYAYPLLASSYILVCLGAAVWPGIHENLTPEKLIGVVLIAFGVTLSARTTAPGRSTSG